MTQRSADHVAQSALGALLEMRNATFLAQDTAERLCVHRLPFGLLDGSPLQAQKCLLYAARLQESGGSNQPMLPTRTSTCAVVGSGAGLLRSKAGAFIDTHDYVIRFNAAPPLIARTPPADNKMYAQDVGSRTSLRIATHAPWRHHRRDGYPAERLALYCHNTWLGICHRDILSRYAAAGAAVHVINPVLVGRIAGLVDSVSDRPRSRAPSTGLIGLGIAVSLCGPRINLFGFGNVTEAGRAGYADRCDHYWECRVPSSAYFFDRAQRLTHDWKAQWRVLTWLASQQRLTLHSTRGGELFVKSTLPPASLRKMRSARRLVNKVPGSY